MKQKFYLIELKQVNKMLNKSKYVECILTFLIKLLYSKVYNMEEDKTIKKQRIFKTITKTISYVIITLLVFSLCILITFIASAKIAEKSEKKPLFGLYTIISPSMEPAINVYDVVFVIKKDFNKLKKDDIITFYSNNPLYGGRPITHRIVSVNDNGSLTVKGDANENVDGENIYSENVIGKVALIIPEFGKLQFFMASKKGWVIAILIPAIWIIGYDIYKLVKLIAFKIHMKKISNKHGNI